MYVSSMIIPLYVSNYAIWYTPEVTKRVWNIMYTSISLTVQAAWKQQTLGTKIIKYEIIEVDIANFVKRNMF